MIEKLKKSGLIREKMFIDGQWLDSENGKTKTIKNPATGEVIGCVPMASRQDTNRAVESAYKAQKLWAKQSAYTRSKALRKLYDLMMEYKEELAYIMTVESGKVITESRGEVNYSAGFVEWYAEEAKRTYGQCVPASFDHKRIKVIRQPVGVASIITPWNFPSAMITRKIAPAIAVGCACIVKPSGYTPFSALVLAELSIRAGIPAGVLNIVTGSSNVVGDALLESDKIRKLSFTGSTEVGKQLMKKSADTVKRISLELGGHAPFIVFDDADIDNAVEGAIASKFRNSGQTCICANRFYVQKGVYKEFSDKLVEAVKSLRVANGLDDNAQIGPLINQAGIEKVKKHIEDAVNKGAVVLTGGKVSKEGGNFFEPTVIGKVNHDMIITEEETFGPVAPLIAFETEEEAIAQANNTRYGLASYYYTNDADRLTRVAEALEYGIVGANDGVPSTPQAPFGGIKESGIGREGGFYGLDEYLEYKFISQSIKNK